jgi:hypothetical protein
MRRRRPNANAEVIRDRPASAKLMIAAMEAAALNRGRKADFFRGA